MNKEIQKVNIWYKVNGLRINIEKTNFMHFAPLNKQYDKNLLTLKFFFIFFYLGFVSTLTAYEKNLQSKAYTM